MKDKVEQIVKSFIHLLNEKLIWLFPVFAIAYFDATVAMLFIMFLYPLVLFIIFLLNKIAKYFSYEKKLVVFLKTLVLVFTAFVLYFGFTFHSPEKMFESFIISPLPKSVEIIEKGGQASVMGISSFYIVFKIKNEDFSLILNSKKFTQKNIKKIEGRKPELYKRALKEAEELMDDASEIYINDDENSKYRCTVLITNKKHNKIYYRVF